MSGNEKAGNGRGNSHRTGASRRPFRRRNKDNNTWQEGGASSRSGIPEKNNALYGGEASYGNGASRPSGAAQKGRSPVYENQGRQNRGFFRKGGENTRGENSRSEKVPYIERPKWVPPKLNTDPLPAHDCPWCGKPIKDIALAISDKDSGAPVHFECVAEKIAQGESLDRGDVITYIGGGRFGIVNFGNSDSPRDSSRDSLPGYQDFKIKKIIEWENKDKRAEWRSVICDHYSVTV